MRHLSGIAAAALIACLALFPACGDDQIERGLTVDREVADPASPAELDETEQERDEEFVEELQPGEAERPRQP